MVRRCTILVCRLFRRGWSGSVFLQIDTRCILVGCGHNDHCWIWRHEVHNNSIPPLPPSTHLLLHRHKHTAIPSPFTLSQTIQPNRTKTDKYTIWICECKSNIPNTHPPKTNTEETTTNESSLCSLNLNSDFIYVWHECFFFLLLFFNFLSGSVMLPNEVAV